MKRATRETKSKKRSEVTTRYFLATSTKTPYKATIYGPEDVLLQKFENGAYNIGFASTEEDLERRVRLNIFKEIQSFEKDGDAI